MVYNEDNLNETFVELVTFTCFEQEKGNEKQTAKSNSNLTERSTIQGVNARVISRLEIMSMIKNETAQQRTDQKRQQRGNDSGR